MGASGAGCALLDAAVSFAFAVGPHGVQCDTHGHRPLLLNSPERVWLCIQMTNFDICRAAKMTRSNRHTADVTHLAMLQSCFRF